MAGRPKRDLGISEAESRIALLIDSENQVAARASQILSKAAELGDVVRRAAYADWTMPHVRPWAKACQQYGTHQVQVNRAPAGKNTVDNYMSAEATWIAGDGRIDAICFVTNDRDFSGAAASIRSTGKDVFCIGIADGSHHAFADVFTRFVVLDGRSSKLPSKPRPEAARSAPKAAGPKRKPKPSTPGKAGASAKSVAKSTKAQGTPTPATKKPARPSSKSTPAPKGEPTPVWVPRVVELVRILSQNGDCPSLNTLGQHMRKSSPPIEKTSKSTTLTKMLESQPKWFRLKKTRDGKRVVGVCLTPAASKDGSPPPRSSS